MEMPAAYRHKLRTHPGCVKIRAYYRAILDPEGTGVFDPETVLDLLIGLHPARPGEKTKRPAE